jgi:hypothetical protein
MKVFISWSGNKSHKIALIFRDWFPSVIQSIEPYVSSEDIDKGARWSTDIAKELENSTFGILCVTKENMNAPWLAFEAGALSKTMDKSYVSPFLFDLKYSEVNGPMLQFQSTIFQRDDIRKLLVTINKACGDLSISDVRLEKAFEVWYPTLEKELNNIKEIHETVEQEKSHESSKIHNSEILEQILDLSRNNQKILRNTDNKLYDKIANIEKNISELISIKQNNNEKVAFDLSNVTKNINIENLQKLQEQIEQLLSAIGNFHESDGYGNYYTTQRIFFNSLFDPETTKRWLDSLKSLVQHYKLSRFIYVENLFKEFQLSDFNRDGREIPYKIIFDLNTIYNSLEKEDQYNLVNTVIQQLNNYYVDPNKIEIEVLSSVLNPSPATIDDLPF